MGAYSYKEADDLLRFKVKPVYLAEKREPLPFNLPTKLPNLLIYI